MMKSPVNNARQLYTPLQRTNGQAHLRRLPARRATLFLLLGCLCLGLAISWRARATKAAIYQAPLTTLTVNNTGDTNDANLGDGVCADSANNCTLRAAIQEAGSPFFAAGATVDINFSVTGTITLTLNSGINRTLLLSRKININGPGASLLTVDANGANRVVFIRDFGSPSNVLIKGLTLKGGDVSDEIGEGKGGVIYQTGSSASSLALDSVVLTGGTALNGGGVSLESGTFTISNSTINGNTALIACGGVYLNFGGNLTITNSTISGNYSVDHGGGVCNQASTVTIRKSTITLNQAGSGGGIHNYLGGNLTLGNSVVAGNTGVFATPRPDIWNEPASGLGGSFTDEGYDVVGKLDGANDAGTVFLPGLPNSNHDFVGTIVSPVDARLAPLAGNGGPTQTHGLLAGSLAIDHGSAVSGVTTDQRGQPRPFDNTFVVSASGGDGSDIGAFEEQSSLDPGPTALTLGNYPNSTVSLSADANVNPDAAATNATRINISTSIRFKGTFAADPTTGLVRVTNASPAGTYTVTVTAFNGDGATTSKSFQLTVQAGVACTGTSFFTTAADVAVGLSPFAAAVGDFNRDGRQDLVVTNGDNSGVVLIRLGNGSGGFSSVPNASIGVGNRPAGVAVGDFNGDGKPDLAIANNASTTVIILLGDGAGGFSSPVEVGVGANPISVAVGDFNNDGKQDLAVGNFISNNVSIRLGDGLGGFGGSTDVGVGTRPFSVAVGDFNNDGKQDFAVANSLSNNVSIRLGDGAGNFSSAADVATGSGPRSVAVGDFNGDGNQDLAVGNNSSNTVSIRLGDGAGNFSGSTNVIVGSSPSSVVIGDFNNDGRQDFAAAIAAASSVSIRLGDGSGGFSGSINVGIGPNSQGVVVGDFNQDGKQDFAALNSSTSAVSIRLGACNAAPTITAAAGLSRQPGSPATNSQIATVTDDGGAGNVVVTVTSANPSTGVTISNIVNANGNITADIAALCGAANASFTLQASDGTATSTTTLNVAVTNTGPALTYAPQTVALNGSLNITPATASGNIASYALQSAGTYTGTISVNNTTGAVSISNAAPVGSHTITIRATDNCGAITDATFTLSVTDLTNICTSIVVSGSWSAAATWGCGHVPTVTDAVVIQPGHNVMLDINPLALSITVNGTLKVGSGGAALANDLQVNGTLSFASGPPANIVLSPLAPPASNNLITGNNIVTVACAGAITGASASGFVVGNVKKNYCSAGTFTFPVGTNTNGNEYSPVDVNVTALGMNPSSLTVKPTRGTAPATPPLLDPLTLDRYWTLTESGDLTADVTFNYLPSDVTAPEGNHRIIRIANSAPAVWPNSAPDTVNHKATATGVSAFSDWTLSAPAAPTASDGKVTGRIVDDQGNPVEGAVVRLSGSQDRKFITDANGFYSFENVETNGFYNVTPSRANYTFSPSVISFSQIGETTNATFGATSAISASGGLVNPLDTSEYFVRQQYVDVLGREPDEGGFNYWSDTILSCGADALCVNTRRRDVAAAFFIEDEFQASGSFIYDVYAGALGRRPMFGEYSFDRQQVVGGTTLDAAKNAFAQNFVQRAEFLTKYQNATTAESFVDALIQNLQSFGVNIAGERANLIASYNHSIQGAEPVAGRAAVIRSLADNTTFKQSQYNQAFVLTEYFAYLRRDPDQSGYDFWLNVLSHHDLGNYRGMVCSFITSGEYQRRFSSVVSHSNGECGQ